MASFYHPIRRLIILARLLLHQILSNKKRAKNDDVLFTKNDLLASEETSYFDLTDFFDGPY
jgi:hypothetical protein